MKKSQKAILIMLGLLPLMLLSCMLYIPAVSAFPDKLVAIVFYGSIILLPVTFLFYRLKVSKVKVWRVVLEAAGVLLIEYLLMVLVGLALVYYGLIPLA